MTAKTVTTAEDILEAMERIRPVVEHFQAQGEKERRIRPEVVDAMRSEGLFRLKLPHEFGGEETELTAFVQAVEALARIDASAGWTFANLATSGVIAALLPEAAAKQVFGNDGLLVGSVIPRGRAVPVEGGYRVSGRWPLASGCHYASWLGGCCIVFDGDSPRMSQHGAPELTMMIFEAREAQILDTWHSTGMKGTDSADVAAENVFVPADLSFPVFTAVPRVAGAIFRLRINAHFFTALSATGLGIARAAIDAFMDIAQVKTPTLSQSVLANRPTIHAAVARAEARYQSARAYLHEVTREIGALLESDNSIPPELESRRRLACVNIGESCEEVVDSMFRLAGTTAIYEGNPLDRHLRDIHTVNQHIAVSPVWWEKTGQFYFGQGLGMP